MAVQALLSLLLEVFLWLSAWKMLRREFHFIFVFFYIARNTSPVDMESRKQQFRWVLTGHCVDSEGKAETLVAALIVAAFPPLGPSPSLRFPELILLYLFLKAAPSSMNESEGETNSCKDVAHCICMGAQRLVAGTFFRLPAGPTLLCAFPSRKLCLAHSKRQ